MVSVKILCTTHSVTVSFTKKRSLHVSQPYFSLLVSVKKRTCSSRREVDSLHVGCRNDPVTGYVTALGRLLLLDGQTKADDEKDAQILTFDESLAPT